MSFKLTLDLTVTINLLNIKLRHFLTIAIDRKLLCIINFFLDIFSSSLSNFSTQKAYGGMSVTDFASLSCSYTIKLNMIV